jgi:hypothetical protein
MAFDHALPMEEWATHDMLSMSDMTKVPRWRSASSSYAMEPLEPRLQLALALFLQLLHHAADCTGARSGKRTPGDHSCKQLLRCMLSSKLTQHDGSKELGLAKKEDFEKVDCGYCSRQALRLLLAGAPGIADIMDPDRPRPYKSSIGQFRKMLTLVADLMTHEGAESWTEDQCRLLRTALRLGDDADKAAILDMYEWQGMA